MSFNLPHKTDYNWTYKDDSKKLAVLKKGEYGSKKANDEKYGNKVRDQIVWKQGVWDH